MDENEQTRRRINFAIIETGKIVFMCKIKTKLENTDLKDFLNDPTNKHKIEELKLDNVLTQEQFELLYPSSPDEPELEKFDFALLLVLIRTLFCSVPHDNKIWNKGNVPDLNDTTLEADIVRLRNVKNDIKEQEEEQYDEIWLNIYEILLRIGSDIPDLQTKLDTYKDTSRVLSPEEEDNVDKVLLRWNDMERAFESGFDLSPSDARTMQMKLYSLIVDGGCIVFKSLLDDLIPSNSLQHLINSNQTLIDQLHRRQIIDLSQYNILFPSVGSPTSKDFDISLFTVFFRNFCGFKASNDPIWDARIPPVPADVSKEADIVRIRNCRNEASNDPIWDARIPPVPADVSKEADIVRIRNCRNEISHLSKTSAITKEVFDTKWDDISQVLVRLKGTGLDDEQMKEEIDRLKSEPLDPKKANELEKELEAWIKMDEKIQQNIIKEIQKHSLCEAAIERSKGAVDNVLSDEMFVKTRQYDEARQMIKDNGIVVLAGAPGEGKSTIAKKLVKELSDTEEKKYIKLDIHSQWDYVLEDIGIVFIDDMFGEGIFDKGESRKWQKHIPTMSDLMKKKRIQIIVTSRSYILEEAKDKLYVDQLFTAKDILTLSSKNLRSEEKREILLNHFRHNQRDDDALIEEIINIDIGVCDTSFTIGFPECARLFSSNNELFKTKVEFFQRPMTHVKKCISNLLDDDDVFVAFFLLWAQSAQTLLSCEVELPVKETKFEILDPILRLQFRAEKYLRKVRYVLLTHKDGFIRYDEDYEQFSFSHRVVRDAVGIASYERNPTAVLQFCDVEFIKNCTRTARECKKRVALSPARYEQLSHRIGNLALPGLYKTCSELDFEGYIQPTIFQSKIFDDQRFCSVFLKTLEKYKVLTRFFTSPVRSVMSEFIEFRFLESKVSNVEILLPSFLIFITGDCSTFCEQLLDKLECVKWLSPKQYEMELEMSMLFAVRSGNCKVIEKLFKKGGKCKIEMIAIALMRDDDNMLDTLCSYRTVEEQATPLLHVFCKAGYIEVVTKLLQKGENVRQQHKNGDFPINEAIRHRHFDLVKILLRHDPDLAEMEIYGVRKGTLQYNVDLLHFSVIAEQENIIDLLTDMEYSTSSVDNFGRTSFYLAIFLRKAKIAETLLEFAIKDGIQCKPDKENNTPLLIAITNAGETSVTSVLHERMFTNKMSATWRTIIYRLCEFSENIHLKNNYGKTPIEEACHYGLVEIVSKILVHGTQHKESGIPIFHHFVIKGDLKCIQTLLKSDIDPNIFDINRNTPYMLAKAMGKKSIAQFLITDMRILRFHQDLGFVTPDVSFLTLLY